MLQSGGDRADLPSSQLLVSPVGLGLQPGCSMPPLRRREGAELSIAVRGRGTSVPSVGGLRLKLCPVVKDTHIT